MRFRVFLTLILLFSFSVFATAQDKEPVDGIKYFNETKRWYNEFTEHWFYFFDISEEEIRDSIAHWDRIGEDIRNSTNRAEGTFGNGGDTHGDYLRWSEKSGFIWLNVNKCNGGPMKITRGRVSLTQSSVKFIPEKVLGGTSSHGNHNNGSSQQEFLFVTWRKADFLIQEKYITDFANYAAGLNLASSDFYDEGRYFSKVLQDYSGSVNELPIFPVGYEKFVKSPLRTTILSIGKSYRRSKPKELYDDGTAIEQNYDDLVTEVKVNLGKSSGVSRETLLRFLVENEDDYSTDGVVIKKIYPNYSTGEYVIDIPKRNCKKSEYETCEFEPGRTLKVGLKLSTTGEW